MTHVHEERLALYLESYLEPAELRSIEEHLVACRKCQELLAEFRGNSDALKARLGEPTSDQLLVMRKGVIQQLEKRRTGAVRWRWVMASIAAAAVMAVAILFGGKPQRGNKIQHPSFATTAHLHVPYRAIAEISIPNLSAEMAHARRRPQHETVGIRNVSLLAEQDGPRILKMTTADPNVVILWQLDERIQRP